MPTQPATAARRPWLPTLLAVLAVAVAASWAALAFMNRAPERLAALQARHLPEQSSEAARETLERAPELGQASIEVLVVGLTDKRAEVAYRAAGVLREQVIHWSHARTAESEAALQRLAGELAANLENFSPASRAEAGQLADAILTATPPRGTERPLATLVACEKVMRANLASRDEAATPETAALPAESVGVEVER